jgi:hypothetical protein
LCEATLNLCSSLGSREDFVAKCLPVSNAAAAEELALEQFIYDACSSETTGMPSWLTAALNRSIAEAKRAISELQRIRRVIWTIALPGAGSYWKAPWLQDVCYATEGVGGVAAGVVAVPAGVAGAVVVGGGNAGLAFSEGVVKAGPCSGPVAGG